MLCILTAVQMAAECAMLVLVRAGFTSERLLSTQPLLELALTESSGKTSLLAYTTLIPRSSGKVCVIGMSFLAATPEHIKPAFGQDLAPTLFFFTKLAHSHYV